MARKEGASSSPASMAWSLLLLRLFVGGVFLQSSIAHWAWLGAPQLSIQLKTWTQGDIPAAYSTYIPFLTRFIIPHANIYSWLIVLGGVCVGGLLVLGAASRLAALPALFMSINYLLATWNMGFEWQVSNGAMVAMELAILLSGAGRFAGVDSALAKKKPNWPIW